MRKSSGRGHVIIIIIGFSVSVCVQIDISRSRPSWHRATKLLYTKLESSLLDYLSLSIASYTRTLALIGDRGIARARSSLVHTCTYVST